MKWHRITQDYSIEATCEAIDKVGAVQKLKPKHGDLVVSDASWRLGMSRTVTDALRNVDHWCTLCRRPIGKGEGKPGTHRHRWCAEADARRRGANVKR